MPAALTARMDPNDPEPNVYGMTCPEHPWATRTGLGQAHATNAVAKHNRDHHPEPALETDLDLSALAAVVVAAQAHDDEAAATLLLGAWQALLGWPTRADALQYARTIADAGDVTAHVAPF